MYGWGSEKTGLDERLSPGEPLALRVIVAVGVEDVTQSLTSRGGEEGAPQSEVKPV